MTLEDHGRILSAELLFEAMRNGIPRGGMERSVEVVAPDRTPAVLTVTLKPARKLAP